MKKFIILSITVILMISIVNSGIVIAGYSSGYDNVGLRISSYRHEPTFVGIQLQRNWMYDSFYQRFSFLISNSDTSNTKVLGEIKYNYKVRNFQLYKGIGISVIGNFVLGYTTIGLTAGFDVPIREGMNLFLEGNYSIRPNSIKNVPGISTGVSYEF